MVRRSYDGTGELVPHSKAKMGAGSVTIASAMKRNILPPKYMGLDVPNSGSSIFAPAAHRVQSMKAVDNLLNDGVADQLQFELGDANGVYTTPYKLGDQIMRPNANGKVRICDNGKIKLFMEFKQYERSRVDDIVEMAMLGDELCAYIFGLEYDEWMGVCKAGKIPPGMDSNIIHKSLVDLDCSIQFIESLGPSILQTQSIAKLRKLCAFYEAGVNIDDLTSLADIAKNMRDGHNNPNDLSGNVDQVVAEQVKKDVAEAIAASKTKK
jgi:hypothetical protein